MDTSLPICTGTSGACPPEVGFIGMLASGTLPLFHYRTTFAPPEDFARHYSV